MRPSTIVEALNTRATDCPAALAFIIEREPITFGQLHADARWLANRLTVAGLHRGSRCVIMLPTSLDFVRTMYATQMLGAIPAAIDPGIAPAARDLRIRTVSPSVIVTTDAHAADLEDRGMRKGTATIVTPAQLATMHGESGAATALPAPDEIAYLQFTSGTSGVPRACAVSHGALMAALHGMQERYALTPRDVLANWLPLHYSSGLVRHVFGTVCYGCPSHLLRASAAELGRWLRLISDVHATMTTSPDFAYRLAPRMVSLTHVDLRSLRIAINGGEAVRASTVTAFERRFGLDRIVQPAYGLSEGTLAVASCGPGDRLQVDEAGHVCCGLRLDGVDLRVVDDAGSPCAPHVEGEIQFRGAVLFSGYFGNEAETRSQMHDGWFQPGDRGYVDADGRVFLISRTRAMIKRGGVGIAPREIEEPVERIPGVLGAAAIGVSRQDSVTEDVVVVIEIPDDCRPDAARLARDVQDAAAAAVHVTPVTILVVPRSAIPRTMSGKVRYADLRAAVADLAFRRNAWFVG